MEGCLLVDEFLARVTETTPVPDRATVLVLAVCAAVLIAWHPTWKVLRQAVTMAHEGAHALVAVLSGRRLGGIRLHSDTSGITVSRGLPRGPGLVATLAAGYLGPALLGLLGAMLLTSGRAVLMLTVLLAILVLLVIQIRNWFGLLAVLVSGGLLLALARSAAAEVQVLAAYVLAWFFLLAAPRAVVDLHHAHRRGRGRDSDAGQLARLTPLPAWAWIASFFALTVVVAAAGAWLLLTPSRT